MRAYSGFQKHFYERQLIPLFTAPKNLHVSLPSTGKINIVLVSPHVEDEAALRAILSPADWRIHRCESVGQAQTVIRTTNPALILSEASLPDGNWKTMLTICDGLAEAPHVLVISRHADENLWAEVLNLGGYDVLLKPFDKFEVTRVTAMACRQAAAPLKPPTQGINLSPQFA